MAQFYSHLTGMVAPLGQGLSNQVHTIAESMRERTASKKITSDFRTTGKLTPEEFIRGGDELVHKYRFWEWGADLTDAEPKDGLQRNKQYLVQRDARCSRRAKDGVGDAEDDVVVQDFLGFAGDSERLDEEGWLKPGKDRPSRLRGEDLKKVRQDGNAAGEVLEEEEEIGDIDDDEDEDGAAVIGHGAAMGSVDPEERRYNIYITYASFYQTPRYFLSGYDYTGQPLSWKLMEEDFLKDYSNQTITAEAFPLGNLGTTMASLHPCRHHEVMLALTKRVNEGSRLKAEDVKQDDKSGDSTNGSTAAPGEDGLTDKMANVALSPASKEAPGEADADGFEQIEHFSEDDAYHKDTMDLLQYMLTFAKFAGTVAPTIEYDFTGEVRGSSGW